MASRRRAADDAPRHTSFSGLTLPRDELKSDRVAAELERRIFSGELATGTRLPTETELCEILGVSRSVVRDAIRSLVARGLVTVKQGHGMTVTEPSDASYSQALITLLVRSDLTMGDVVTARGTIETRLVPLAALNGTEEDWERLEGSYGAFAAAVDAGDWDGARDRHVDFHVGLLRAIHQPALELLLKPMTEIILISGAPPRQTAKVDWEVESHRPVLDAVKARDASRAEAAMAAHFVAAAEPARYEAFHARPFSAVFNEVPWARPGAIRPPVS
jgi:GntR family transcriptional repressor for pyruvate dehydrogenase complex